MRKTKKPIKKIDLTIGEDRLFYLTKVLENDEVEFTLYQLPKGLQVRDLNSDNDRIKYSEIQTVFTIKAGAKNTIGQGLVEAVDLVNKIAEQKRQLNILKGV